METIIEDVVGREILDSRGNPTVEVEVLLLDGSSGRAAVRSANDAGRNPCRDIRPDRGSGCGAFAAGTR